MTASVIPMTTPLRAYKRLVSAIVSDREITMPDAHLITAARFALDSGYVTTARVALNELDERQAGTR